MRLFVGEHVGAHLLEEIVGKHKFIKRLTRRLIYLVHITHPLATAIADKDDIFTYAEH